jgi:hypothetical protein
MSVFKRRTCQLCSNDFARCPIEVCRRSSICSIPVKWMYSRRIWSMICGCALSERVISPPQTHTLPRVHRRISAIDHQFLLRSIIRRNQRSVCATSEDQPLNPLFCRCCLWTKEVIFLTMLSTATVLPERMPWMVKGTYSLLTVFDETKRWKHHQQTTIQLPMAIISLSSIGMITPTLGIRSFTSEWREWFFLSNEESNSSFFNKEFCFIWFPLSEQRNNNRKQRH